MPPWASSDKCLGNLAFQLVLDSQFAEARTRCEEAQRLAHEIGDGVKKTERDDLIFIQGNLAHALLFQGDYEEAHAIYRQNWDNPLYERTFGEITLEDFVAFDKAGLTHPYLSRMKRTLGFHARNASSCTHRAIECEFSAPAVSFLRPLDLPLLAEQLTNDLVYRRFPRSPPKSPPHSANVWRG